MTDIDYSSLQGERGGEPPDGVRSAYLLRAALTDTRSGSMLITEWQDDLGHYWETWYGFAGRRLSITQELLKGLGILDRVTDDAAFEQALGDVQGNVWTVRTERWGSGSGGGVNTYVEGNGSQAGAQTALAGMGGQNASWMADIPADTSGLPPATAPPPEPVAAAVPEDDEIPF